MLQALNIKNIDSKATAKASGAIKGEKNLLDSESMLEGADFANELKATLADGKEVKPTELTEQQLKELQAKMLEASGKSIEEIKIGVESIESQPQSVTPKAFDPALTKGVDAIIQPKTTSITDKQVLELAQMNPETVDVKAETVELEALLKAPASKIERSPAIDLAKGEIDPQLINMEDFVAQKNLAVKKSINNANAYGMPGKAEVNKVALENGLKSTQTINELGAAESGKSSTSSMNSQQFILNSQMDIGGKSSVNDVQSPMKTFNMSQIKTDNPNQIMTQITDYIVQAKAAKEPTVNMRVKHDELGIIDISVQRTSSMNDAIAINIGTHSVDGKNFFQANSKDLFSHLTNSGLNIADLKVETPNQTAKNDFDFGSQSGRGGHPQDRQFGSEQNQKRHESERRQELWNLLKDKEAA
jgi:hypothetical protein